MLLTRKGLNKKGRSWCDILVARSAIRICFCDLLSRRREGRTHQQDPLKPERPRGYATSPQSRRALLENSDQWHNRTFWYVCRDDDEALQIIKFAKLARFY